MEAGDILCIHTPGAGGYGPPGAGEAEQARLMADAGRVGAAHHGDDDEQEGEDVEEQEAGAIDKDGEKDTKGGSSSVYAYKDGKRYKPRRAAAVEAAVVLKGSVHEYTALQESA